MSKADDSSGYTNRGFLKEKRRTISAPSLNKFNIKPPQLTVLHPETLATSHANPNISPNPLTHTSSLPPTAPTHPISNSRQPSISRRLLPHPVQKRSLSQPRNILRHLKLPKRRPSTRMNDPFLDLASVECLLFLQEGGVGLDCGEERG